MVRASLGHRKPLIGFAGAPFTLASYLIEGGASRQYQATKTLMYTHPEVWDRMMTMIASVTADYLKMQIEAGADVVQLFDSWVGSLGPDDYRRFAAALYAQRYRRDRQGRTSDPFRYRDGESAGTDA